MEETELQTDDLLQPGKYYDQSINNMGEAQRKEKTQRAKEGAS